MKVEGFKWLSSRERRLRWRRKRYRVAAVRFHVPKMKRDELIRQAKINILTRSEFAPEEPLYRECVAYLQHSAVTPSWNFIASTTYGKFYLRLCRKLYAAIGDAYPWLRGECKRQLARRERQVGDRIQRKRAERRRRKRARDPFATAVIVFNEDTPEYFKSVGSLNPSRFFYLAPFPKAAVIKARRFGANPNDNWWEWEEEFNLTALEGRPDQQIGKAE